MNTTNKLWQIVAAVGLALLAVLLTTFYVTNYKRHVQHGQADVTVYVASKDIPVDTQGVQLLGGSWLTKASVPRRQVVPGAVSSPDQLRDLIATEPIFAGEQVTTRRFGTPQERGVRAQLKGTQRAIELDGDPHQLLAGTLHAGDHVDIVGTWDVQGNDATTSATDSRVARVFIRDVLVLATSGTAKGTAISGGAGGSVQLRLTDAQSQRMQWMVSNGKWRLEIRPQADAKDSPRTHDDGNTLLKDGVGIR
jgi:pilus assembly protein CpaB